MSDNEALQQALAAHWEAKHALDYWREKEAQTKLVLADILSAAADGYINKTLTLGDGTKLELAVSRDLKVNNAAPEYREFITKCVENALITREQLDAFRKEEKKVKWSLTGYRDLPDNAKNALKDVVTVRESVSIKYTRPVENR